MKKKEVKKLQLSRETLHDLKGSDARKVVGGVEPWSCQTGRMCCQEPD
ncbi:MAG: hypothetical protein QOJ16_1730 [Acidobacteriota bacterium]|jgi:hypothetical protein|nr:hypothetical protein [Acidobacteriota bacterium]